MTAPTPCGCLFVVATPIGNLEDITHRAVRILTEVDLIAAEDTRVSRKLLSHLGINTPLVSHYKGQENRQSQRLLAHLQQGQDIALISDAGTPAIADPGAILVQRCHELEIPVSPIPGPSALTALLSVAGIVEAGFVFLGFLPAKKKQRQQLLHRYRHETLPVIFYESPHRIIASLKEIATIFGERPLCLGRELSKLHEEILVLPAQEAQTILQARGKIRGEFAILIHSYQRPKTHKDTNDIDTLLTYMRDQGDLSMKDAVKKISHDLDISRSTIYRKALAIWKKS